MAPTAKDKQPGLRRVLGLFSASPGEPRSPWLPKGTYPVLATLDTAALGVSRQSGVYACWHLGARPRWIRVGGHRDLAFALTQLQQRREVTALAPHGGVYVAWALVPGAELAGVIAYMSEQLKPILQGLAIAGEAAPGPVGAQFPLPPGTRMP